MDAGKIALTVGVSMLMTVPLFAWLILGASGALGAGFAETGSFRTVTFVLVGLTVVLVFVVLPFFVYPRIFDGEGSGHPLLTEGLRATGTVRGAAPRHGERITVSGIPCIPVDMTVRVESEGSAVTMEHRELVPEDLVHLATEGSTLPLRVSRDDPTKIAVDWEAASDQRPMSSISSPSQ